MIGGSRELWSTVKWHSRIRAHANRKSVELFRLEKTVRNAVFKGEQEDIRKIVDQLCHDYAYAVHQPHARNGGLIGLAAASIALGPVSLR